jgi:hypothetical protein
MESSKMNETMQQELDFHFESSFMKPQTLFGNWYLLETSEGGVNLPVDEYGDNLTDDELAEATETDIEEVNKAQGFGARLSANGYTDCTEWTFFDTEEEAVKFLIDTYGKDDE